MNRVNLLPPPRITAGRRRRAIRRWVWVDGAYAVVLTIVAAAYACATTEPPAADAGVIDTGRLNASLVTLRQQSATLDAQWRSAQEIAGRPDWGILLTILADRSGDDVTLDGVDALPPAAAADQAPRTLTITGVGRSQAAVSAFVLRLEATNVFDRVRLAQALPDAARVGAGVAFRVTCALPEDKP